MKSIIYNAGYFLKETKTMLRLSLLSNVISIFSTGLILFILAMAISGWWISSEVAEAIQGEAEINVYFDDGIDSNGALKLVEDIKAIEGVREASLIKESEAYSRMEKILGKEARVLEFLDSNPFSPFIEVKIHLEKMNDVLGKLSQIKGVDHVRDNREVLERIQSISGILEFLGYLVVAAVFISTLVIIAHIIRLGVYNNREQINTLRLLGAPETFIALPFLLEGLILTLAGGIMAAALTVFALKQVYVQIASPLPFIPLPPREALVPVVVALVMSMSAALGIIGSIFGLSSGKTRGRF